MAEKIDLPGFDHMPEGWRPWAAARYVMSIASADPVKRHPGQISPLKVVLSMQESHLAGTLEPPLGPVTVKEMNLQEFDSTSNEFADRTYKKFLSLALEEREQIEATLVRRLINSETAEQSPNWTRVARMQRDRQRQNDEIKSALDDPNVDEEEA